MDLALIFPALQSHPYFFTHKNSPSAGVNWLLWILISLLPLALLILVCCIVKRTSEEEENKEEEEENGEREQGAEREQGRRGREREGGDKRGIGGLKKKMKRRKRKP